MCIMCIIFLTLNLQTRATVEAVAQNEKVVAYLKSIETN